MSLEDPGLLFILFQPVSNHPQVDALDQEVSKSFETSCLDKQLDVCTGGNPTYNRIGQIT